MVVSFKGKKYRLKGLMLGLYIFIGLLPYVLRLLAMLFFGAVIMYSPYIIYWATGF